MLIAISSIATAQIIKKDIIVCQGQNIQWTVPENIHNITIHYKTPAGVEDTTYNINVNPNYIFVVNSNNKK